MINLNPAAKLNKMAAVVIVILKSQINWGPNDKNATDITQKIVHIIKRLVFSRVRAAMFN